MFSLAGIWNLSSAFNFQFSIFNSLVALLLLAGSVFAQSRANNYLQQDSSHFRAVFCPEDVGVIPSLWQTLHDRVATVELQLGVSFKDTATFVITPTEREWLRITQGAPLWANGIAYPERGAAVLKSPRFSMQYGPLGTTAIHEYAHLLLQSDAPDAGFPHWFDEGVASVVAGQMTFMDHTLVGRAVTAHRLHTFSDLQHLMAMPAPEAQLGYAESALAVQLLVEKFGWPGVGNLIHTVRQGVYFEDAFARTFSVPLGQFESEYRASIEKTYRLSWLSDTEIWVSALFVLAVFAAGIAAWRRRRRKLAEWEQEQRGTTTTVSGDAPYVINYELIRSRREEENEERGTKNEEPPSDEDRP